MSKTDMWKIVDRLSFAGFIGGIAGVLIGLIWGQALIVQVSASAALLMLAVGIWMTVYK